NGVTLSTPESSHQSIGRGSPSSGVMARRNVFWLTFGLSWRTEPSNIPMMAPPGRLRTWVSGDTWGEYLMSPLGAAQWTAFSASTQKTVLDVPSGMLPMLYFALPC